MSSVSLCLIAKNESAMIGGCLASVRGVVDQIIVVDTGSTDNTRDIAASCGAEVLNFAWCDDFSAARNAALAAVKGEWVLVLDCDERLSSRAGEAIRHAVAEARVDAFVLPLTDSASLEASPDDVVAGRHALRETIWLPRLFRFDPTLRWEGRVHEHVGSWLEQRGGVVGTVNAPIAHYGAVPDYREQRGNSDRNLKLLIQEIQADPSLWFTRTFLVEELLHRSPEHALSQANILWTQIDGELLPAISKGRSQHAVVKSLTACMVVFVQAQHFERAVQCATRAQKVGVDHPNLDFLSGLAYENLAVSEHGNDRRLLLQARDSYFRVLQAEEQVWIDALIGGIRSWNGLMRLSTVLLQLGHPEDALEGFRLAKTQTDKVQRELAMGEAEALLGIARSAEALELLHPWLEADPENSDALILSAVACEQLGYREAARDFWISASKSAHSGLRGLHRLARLNQGLAEMIGAA